MKLKLIRLGITLTLLLGMGGGLCASAEDNNREADHVALRALRDKAAQAIGNQDIKTLATCFAKDFAFTTVNQTVLTNETQMQEFFNRMFHSSDALVTNIKAEPHADILTRFIDANTGVCYGSSKDTYTIKSGKVVEMNVRWSATVVKENGEWKVAIAHVGANFLNNPVLDSLEKLTRSVGVGAGLGGLLIGFIIGRVVGSRKAAR